MNPDFFDAIVIGGGPGGSCTASYLALAGKRVLLLEKEFFPRFHIGESLLPYNTAIFRDLGLLPVLKAAGFPRKTGAQFHLANGAQSTQFIFSRGVFTREHETVQVERAVFDHILLKRARELGADAREGWTVQSFESGNDGVGVKAADPDGKVHSFRAAFLIDASGRGNVTGNQENLREFHPRHKKLSVFGHFAGVQRDPGDRGGDTVIVRAENKWFWLIPVSPEKTSLGLVIDKDEFAKAGGDPEKIFQRWCDSTPMVKERVANARLVGKLQTTSDFSYFNKRYVGHRLLRVGDAAGFMDPIFSAGVFLAMWSGKLASEAVIESLGANSDGAGRLRRYEKRVDGALRFYWRMVEYYYTWPFMELLLQPRPHHHLPDAVNAVLAGELEPGWSVRWRLRYFYFLVKLQSRFPIVPHLPFGPARRGKTETHECAESH
ncbi:MAG: NAD(P)-binding protein [Verrucomicrobia bacterium]|nr:NAD(P)-binding protein [Verrucomicrobiota bacterium]